MAFRCPVIPPMQEIEEPTMNLRVHMTYHPRFVTSADGTQIYADAIGNNASTAPVIVLIHGLSTVKTAFDPIMEDSKWASNAFLVRYDLRGHGRSGMPTSDEAWESKRLAEDFEAVCKEFDVTKAFVLGWSMGATHITDIFNHNTTVSISGFIAVEGPLYNDMELLERTTSPEVMSTLGGLSQPSSVDSFRQTVLDFIPLCSDNLSPEFFRIILEGIFLQTREVFTKVVTRKQFPENLLQAGRDGKLELLVITGGKDKIAVGEKMGVAYKEIGWKKFVLRHLEEASHFPWLSRPDEFRETVLGWVMERNF